MSAIDDQELDRRFTWTSSTQEQADEVAKIQERVREFAGYLNTELPAGREANEALLALEQVRFWSVAASSRPPAPTKDAERPQMAATGHLQSSERSWTPRVEENFHIGFGMA